MTPKTSAILGQLLAIMGGVAAALAWPVASRSGGEPPVAGSKVPREVSAKAPAEVVDAMIAELQKAKEAEAPESTLLRSLSDAYRQLFQSMPPAADPKGAYLELAAALAKGGGVSEKMLATEEGRTQLAMLGVRYAHWLDHDPAGFAAAWSPDDGIMSWVNSHFIYQIANGLVERDGVMKSVDRLQAIQPSYVAMSAIASDLGKRGSVEDLKTLLASKQGFLEDSWNGYGFSKLGEEWPLDRKDELISFASGKGQALAMIGIASRMKGQEAIDWVRGWIEAGEMDKEALAQLTAQNLAGELASAGGLPIPEQVAMIREFGGGGGEREIGNRLVTSSLGEFLADGEQDWLQAYRNGLVTAGEVKAAAREEVGELGEHRNEFDSQLFRHLAEDDLDSAMELLGGMNRKDQDWQKIYAARWWFQGVDPERFVELVSSISLDDPKVNDALWNAWRDKSLPNLERYGEDYFEWVKAMPPGKVRESALRGLHAVTKESYPWIYDEALQLLREK